VTTPSDSFLDNPQFAAVGAAQAVSYFKVYEADEGLLGAFWLGQTDGACGFVPVNSEGGQIAAGVWNERAAMALRAVGHGRDAFEYWSAQGGQGWWVGPVQTATSIDELRITLQPGGTIAP
jgi:hypothetical protein